MFCCRVFDINIIVDILSHFIITQTSNQKDHGSRRPNVLSVSKSLIHPLFIAILAIFLIMQALCL